MYKSQLQELCHQRSWALPEYRTVRYGPDHNPRFTCTVTVNGVSFDTPANLCRSSKESQNVAAQVAFEKLTTTVSAPIVYNPPVHDVSGASSSITSSNIIPEQPASHPIQENHFGWRDDTGSKEILHTFKNRLQQYARKQNLQLPAYSSEFEGPPHARRFRSKVTVGDKTFEYSEFFPNMKEAEHAAAKVAFETLSHGDDIQEDEGLYKSLLQELAQKKGLQFPKYSSARSGPSHLPTFISYVEVGTDYFQGSEAKTKKQAEMSAAKVAYNALLKRKDDQSPSGYNIKGTSGVTSVNLQSTINKGSVQDIALSHSSTGEAVITKDPKIEEKLPSNPVKVIAQFQDPSPLTSSADPSSSADSSSSAKLKHLKCEASDTKDYKPVGAGHKSSRNFIVHPKDIKMGTPDGASIMAYSDDQYVALKLKDGPVQ